MKKAIWKRVVSVLIALLVAGVIFRTILNCSAHKELEQEFAAIKDSGCPMSLATFSPPPVPDGENAFILYNKAFKMSGLGEEEEKAAFELLRKAASCKRSRIPVEYDIDKMKHVRMAHLNCRPLSLKAVMESENGKTDEAVETCRVGLHFANILYSEPNLIAQLIRINCQKLMYETLETIFDQGEPGSPSCRTLLEEITSYGAEFPLVRALELELLNVERTERILKGEIKLYDLGETPRQKLILRFYSSWLGRPILKKCIAYGLRVKRDYIRCYKLPYHEAREAQAKWLSTYRSRRPPWYCYFVNHEWVSRFAFLAGDRTECEAIARIWQLALAIRIYGEEKGSHPESLKELCPTILERLPKDPFSGGDFLYRHEKPGFMVYSVGENLKDDGGEGDDIVRRSLK